MPSSRPDPAEAAKRDLRPLLPPAVFLLFFAFALFQTAPHLTGGDCGEYVTAGAYLGNTHPPGNPVHHMLSFLARQLPFGDAFSRSAMLSAVSAAGAIAVLCSLLLGAGCGGVSAAGTSLLFGFSPVVMRNALVTEVYTLLLLFSLALSLVFLRQWKGDESTNSRRLYLLSFATGLGMGIHYFALVFASPLLLHEWLKGREKGKTALWGAALLFSGFAVMLYLPARSLAHPPADYGSPSTLQPFLHAVTWSEYYSRPAEGRSLVLLLSQISWTAQAMFFSISAPVLPLAVLGAARKRNLLPGIAPLLIGGAAVFASNVVLQNFPSRIMSLSEMPRFLALSVFPLYILAGVGVGELLRLVRCSPSGKEMHRAIPAAVALFFLLAVAVSGWNAARLYDRSGDFVIRDYLRESFLSLPPNAAVFVEGDTANFSALAEHFIERLRTDLLPIDRTGSYPASIYSDEGAPAGTADPLALERLRARKESSFVSSYPFPAAYVTLPDWARRQGGWKNYGRIFLFDTVTDDKGYFLPPSGPIRYERNANTAYDLKTRLYLSSVLYRDFLKSPRSFPYSGNKMGEILEVSWDNPAFFATYGSFCMEEGDLKNAEQALRHALLIYPPSIEARKYLGILLARSNRLNDAAPYLSDPELADSPESRFYLGNYFNHLGEAEKAIGSYEHALSLGYRTAPLLSNLGVAYARKGDPGKARALFREALRVDPGYTGARINLEKMEKEMRRK